MNSNKLIEDNNDLVAIDYNQLLNKILQVLETNKDNIFQLNSSATRLKINVDKIAYEVANSKLAWQCDLGFKSRSATINLSLDSQAKFPNLIRKIAEKMKIYLEEETANKGINLERMLTNLLSDLNKFKGSNQKNFGFKYSFNPQPDLTKECLILDSQISGSDSLLKLHKLTITVKDLNGLEQRLKDGLNNYIETNFNDNNEDDISELKDILKTQINDPNKNSSYYRLLRRVNTETLGQLKKEAKLKYLEYLLTQINLEDKQRFYLQDLIRRLRLLEEYLNDFNKSDDDYTVNYEGITVNYRDLFTRAEAYDSLPIFPIIAGYLGEIRDIEDGEKQFIFGLKIKFNNKVNRGEKPLNSFDYYLSILDPNSKEHKEKLRAYQNNNSDESFQRKVLRIACLYFFIFASRLDPNQKGYKPESELNYNPVEAWENKVMKTLQSNDEAKKKELFSNIIQGFNTFKVKDKITKLTSLLQELLGKSSILPSENYSLHIGVNKNILENDLDEILNNRQDLFQNVLSEKSKECLKYFTIRDGHIDDSYLTNVSVNIKFEDLRYFPTEEKQTFNMSYDLQGIKTLPVIIAALENSKETSQKAESKEFYLKNFNNDQSKLILIAYDDQPLRSEIFNDLNLSQAYFYQVTFSLLIYIAFKVILDAVKIPEKLFIPMLRLHKYNDKEPYPEEKFMRSLSKTLVHLFRENYLANSQGFKFLKKNDYKKYNTLSSLYSVIPKNFTFTNNSYTPQLDKLALIVVSSKESDASYRSDFKISTLFGEIITFQLHDNIIRVETRNTFTGNYNHNDLFDSPEIIIDQINQLYQQGFKHCIYLAKTPYSSTLNLTATAEYDPESLYFLSRDIIKALKGDRQDLKLYPVFYDKYYVKKSQKLEAKALYIQDTTQLTNALNKNKQCAIFFNLFNGESVGNDRFYNGVTSYSTMLNFYEEVLDDQDIRFGLLNNNSLKNDILQYLTLFHFSRYEKSSKISLKLDPYDDIIGEEGLGKTSIFPYSSNNINFNSLAFLTEVRRCLNVLRDEAN